MRRIEIAVSAFCGLALCASSSWGCSPNVPACTFESTGPAVRATASAPMVLDARDDEAMNTVELDGLGQIPPARMGALRRGECGDVGLAFRRGTELVYVSLGDDSASAVGTVELVDDSGDPRQSFSLFFDATCSPVIVQSQGMRLREHTRDAGGVWSVADIDIAASALGGGSFSAISAAVSPDGRMHVLGRTGFDASGTLIHASRAAAPGSAWTFAAHPHPRGSLVYDLTVDREGTLVAVHRPTQFPCDPCNVDVILDRLPVGASAWDETVLQPGTWGPPLDLFVEDASLTFDDMGRPYVAAHFGRHVQTGSYQSAELRLYAGVDEGACGETAVAMNDGYAGSDGARFTGASPSIRRDSTGRLHLLFLDQAVWHADSMENSMDGQLRLATRAGGLWTLSRLTEQAGQTSQARPLLSFGHPQFVIDPAGTRFTAVAVERSWDTDTIYNLTSPPVTLRLVVVSGTLGPA